MRPLRDGIDDDEVRLLLKAYDPGTVWNKANGSNYTFFFIGTNADYQKYGYRHDPQPRPDPIQR